MARSLELENLDEVLVQGFRAGGGKAEYVYLTLISDVVATVKLTTEQANTLGEYLRQEAEFAQQPAGQKEVSNGI